MAMPSSSSIVISIVSLLFLLSLLRIPIFCQILTSELENNNGNEVAEDIANKTYAQEQSDLQRAIFRTYDRKMRPVLNQSRPITVLFHAYLMHFSVDQSQQTIFLNGHIYMTWTDELAVWDSAQFNNVRTTMVKQWEIWQPEIRIANSVSGVNQYFEISRRSHATLTSVGTNRTKVEIYPTFSMRVGCNFDYTDYPEDEQYCAARLYTSSPMSEVELAIYYNLEPSVMLGWGNQSAKRHVQDWELVRLDANQSFYKTTRKYTEERPSSAYEAQSTWTLILLSVRLRRNAPLFWPGLGVPALCSLLLLLLSFLLFPPELALAIVLANFFLQTVLLRDALRTLPPAAGAKPRIVTFAQFVLATTPFVLVLHFFSRQIANKLVRLECIQKLLLAVGKPTGNEANDELIKQKRAAEGADQQQRQHGAGELAARQQQNAAAVVVVQQPLLLLRICCFLVLLLAGIPASLLFLL